MTTSSTDPLEFSSKYTDNFPSILQKLNISLLLTSYQSARLILVRSKGNELETCFKAFPRPTGIYADETRITLGTFTQMLEFKRSSRILGKIKDGALDDINLMAGKTLEKEDEKRNEFLEARQSQINTIKQSDALYLPRASLTTGMINTHDIGWGDEGLWVVNSTFSCLSTLSPDHSFVARWKPPFISKLAPEDRCHLNGMAMYKGRPRWVTTFNQFDDRDSWKKGNRHDGTLIDVDSNTVLVEGLIMPHSPRFHKDKLYLCESGTGNVFRYCQETKKLEKMLSVQGFPRGVAFWGPLMFLGVSKIRASNTENRVPLVDMYNETYCQVLIINLETDQVIATLRFEGDVTQIYDIAVVPDSSYPELLTDTDGVIRHAFDYVEMM